MTNDPNRDWLGDTDDGCQSVMAVAYQLQDLARAFDMTGNVRLADELAEASKALFDARELIKGATGKYAHQMVVQSEEATGNMMRAIFASVGASPKDSTHA
jgi:hypothetical protein